ncbi:MAG: TIGR01459 family HAD-type hydrolase [Rickettsiales bacterium]|nr:MAG: TIGR01459 family HAD-type hydrolase [Rickettsiales bacterium]
MTYYIEEIKEIINKYDYFIIDLWGVIHDGSKPYKSALSAISELKDKKIIFLSNSPKRSVSSQETLTSIGIDRSAYERIITSGEYLYHNIDKLANGPKYFHIGPEKNKNLFSGLNYHEVDDLSESDFLLITGLYDDVSGITKEYAILESAVKKNIIAICPNPDIVVVDRHGTKYLCAGAIAKEYEKIGGSVIYTGKPYIEIYNMISDYIHCKKDKIIAIGDSLTTDMKGANNFGIDSILVTGGILQSEIKEHGIENIFNKYNSNSTYYIDYFR